MLLPGFELVDVQFEHRGLCVCKPRPYLAMSPDGFLVETFRRRNEHALREAAQAEQDAAPRTVLSDTPRPVPVTCEISEIEGAHGTVRYIVVLQYVLRVLVEYKCPYKQRGRRTWMGGADIYPVESIINVPGLRLPVPSYYYTQVQYGCQLLGVLDDLLTWPTHCWVAVWAPAYSPAPLSPPAASSFSSCSSSSSAAPSSSCRAASEDSFDCGSFDDGDLVQPLRTAVSGGGAALNVQTPHGTVQITRVLFNAAYASWAVETATSFWSNRYLPALWQKQNGFLAEGELPQEDEACADVQALLKKRQAKRRRAQLESQALTFDVVGGRCKTFGTGRGRGRGRAASANPSSTTAFVNEFIEIKDLLAIGGGSSHLNQDNARVLSREVADEFGDGFELE